MKQKPKIQQTLREMKLLALFTLLGLCSVRAVAHGQETRIDLQMSGVTLSEVFQQIEELTDYMFVYKSEDIRAAGKVNVNARQMMVKDVLAHCLQGTGLIFSFQDNVIAIKQKLADEKKSVTIKGFVTDGQAVPLPGVTVRVAGTTVGTATNVNGWFSITLPMTSGALEFSFVGYRKQSVPFTEKTDTIRVKLEEDVADLDEVVVRAYGSQNKREMISAISSVKADEMKELPSASITNMLQGRLAGVNIIQQSGAPGSASVIAVRGFNSLLVDGASDGQPLWVVDGVPMHSFVSPVTGTNTLADLDPSMIESVEVLKDAAAASIYGSRAGNGVILVTTKKGKAGAAKFAANISYTWSKVMEYPVQTGGRMDRYLQLLNRRNQTNYYMVFGVNRGFYWPTSYEEIWNKAGVYDAFWQNGQTSNVRVEMNLQDSLDPYYNNCTNWWKYAFRTGKVLNANIQASGGSDKFQYMIGAGIYDEKGIMVNSGYTRGNLISNTTAQLTQSLRLDSRIYLAYVDRTMNKSGSGSSRYEKMSVVPEQMKTYEGASDEIVSEWLDATKGIKDRTDDYRAMASLFLEYKFLKGFSLSASGSIDYSQNNMNKFTPSTLDESYHENKSQGDIMRNLMISTEELFKYNRSFNEIHNIDIMLGLNINKEQNHYIGGYGKRGSSDNVNYYDPSINSPIYNYGTEQSPRWESTTSYESDFEEKVMVSYFGRIGYNFKQRYLMEFTFRRDGSSTFGEGNRWANFPSIALGWSFSEEPFIKRWTGNWLNWGKLRGSYGTSGQIFSDAYLAHGLMRANMTSFQFRTGVYTGTPVAPDLTWEKTEQYDLGLDLDMFNYRVNLKLDYYYKYTSSLIMNVGLPGGFLPVSSRKENAIAVSNEGIELEILADILRDRAVTWRTRFNVAKVWNRLEDSYSDKDISILRNNQQDWFVIGRPLFGMMVYKHNGFYNSDDEVPVYYKINGDATYIGGVTNRSKTSGKVGDYNLADFDHDGSADKYNAGSPLPIAYGGWVNELKWKNFDINMLFSFTLGRKVIRTAGNQLYANIPQAFFDSRDVTFWTAPGDKADFPKYGKIIEPMLDSNIEKVHSLSMRQLTVGYNFEDNWIRKAGLSGMRFFMTVENLFCWSNYSYGNPETIDVYTGLDDGKSYPLPRKWTLGLTLNF
ncbi:SusC/RagA family TonB-linked outer membrane protein [Butyricimonas muris]|uniref:SusC/RagA family TonB-linked outer membrane protein n=1 Tax=Butyricimonas muris TaxID=3378067 RepID=UPI003967CCF6